MAMLYMCLFPKKMWNGRTLIIKESTDLGSMNPTGTRGWWGKLDEIWILNIHQHSVMISLIQQQLRLGKRHHLHALVYWN